MAQLNLLRLKTLLQQNKLNNKLLLLLLKLLRPLLRLLPLLPLPLLPLPPRLLRTL